MLIKGGSTPNAPRLKESYPDSQRKDRKAKARGEVPVWLLNTNLLKDAVDAALKCEKPGPGFMHFPEWLGDWFFEEMTFEVRTQQGWKKPGKGNNEAFDLAAYNRAGAIKLGMEKIDWSNPPPWAREWDHNPNVIQAEAGAVAQPRPVDPPKPQTKKPATRRVRMQVNR